MLMISCSTRHLIKADATQELLQHISTLIYTLEKCRLMLAETLLGIKETKQGQEGIYLQDDWNSNRPISRSPSFPFCLGRQARVSFIYDLKLSQCNAHQEV